MLEQVMFQAIQNNPQYLKMLKEVEDSGMSAKDYFYKKTNEMGVNPEDIINQLK